MKKYYLAESLRPCLTNEEAEDKIIVEIINSSEINMVSDNPVYCNQLAAILKNIHNCKAEMLKNCIMGSFCLPCLDNPFNHQTFAFYLERKHLYFIDDSNFVQNYLDHLLTVQIMPKTVMAHFLFEFLDLLIVDDSNKLQVYYDQLEKMEKSIINNNAKNCENEFLQLRKKIGIISAYYGQLIDLAQNLNENYNDFFSKEDCHLFDFFAKRVERLQDEAHDIKDYAEQIRNMYDSMVSNRQNRIMQTLTVVTTIFMPLTLITGWYGMNFINMPELKLEYGYLVIVLISVVIIIIELIFFKAKKWWK